MENVRIHPTAEVDETAKIGEGTSIWNWAHIRGGAQIGKNCIIAKSVQVDSDVKIGNNVKIQNNVSVYHGVTIEDGVFIGPHVCFTNDKIPRAVNPDGSPKDMSDWKVSEILIKKGAAIGANTTITPGVTIGAWAMTGSGSVITKDVPDHALVYGNPARVQGYVSKSGKRFEDKESAMKED